MLLVVKSPAPSLSNAGLRDEAANTVTVACGMPPLQLHAAMAAIARRASNLLVTGQLHAYVGRLHNGDRGHARLQVELVHRLAGQKRNEPVRPGLDLDLRRDPVLDHARHDAGESVAGRLRNDHLGRLGPAGFRKPGERCAVDQALAAGAAYSAQAPVVDHSTDGVSADSKHLCRLSQSIARHWVNNASKCQRTGLGGIYELRARCPVEPIRDQHDRPIDYEVGQEWVSKARE